MLETDQHYFFYKHQFGQWTLRDIVDIHGVRYNCCEQYMMAQKAILFHDDATYQAIMATEDPKTQKDLGRTIQHFDGAVWDRQRYGVVWQANYLKFTQHPDLAERLIATGQLILAEASPVDLVWGIGLSSSDPLVHDERHWRGQNLLGKVLMSIRQMLIDVRRD